MESVVMELNADDCMFKKLNGYVGLDSLPKQIVKKSLNEGFSFNILLCGCTGIGKTTLVETLFNTKFENENENTHFENKVTLTKNTYQLEENNVHLKLTIVETNGFGDQINTENSHQVLVDYINSLFETRLCEELQLKRNNKQINDKLIHVLLYFIAPTGRSLKPIDIMVMKQLDNKVNIIPVIGKSDIISKYDLVQFKKTIREQLDSNKINIYRFPNDPNMNYNPNDIIPFAVVGSTELVRVGNRLVRGRAYKWGTVMVENESHCDFVKLRDALITKYMIDLIESTHSEHFKLYKTKRQIEMGLCSDDDDDESIIDLYNKKRYEVIQSIQRSENEIKESLIKRIKETEIQFKKAENEIEKKILSFQEEFNKNRDLLDQRRKTLETQIKEFNMRKFKLEQFKNSIKTHNTLSKDFKYKKY